MRKFTAEEIIRSVCRYREEDELQQYDDIRVSEAIEAMNEYADQFKPKWISVEVKLPEFYINFLAFCDGLICLGELCDMGDGVIAIAVNGDHVNLFSDAKFTHWMPLPDQII